MAKQTILRGLKNSFVPHHKNKYKPHALSHIGLAIALVLILITQITYNYTSAGKFQVLGYATNVSTTGLLQSTNQQRSASGLGAFTINAALNQAAQSKAQDLINKNYWDHYGPDGSTPWDFINASGYSYLKAGENLAFGFSDSSGVIQGWMNSPPHAANILDGDFSEVGFGIANGANFQGDENTVVVAMYGQPVGSTIAQVAEPEPTTEAAPEPAPAPEPKPEVENRVDEPEPEPMAWTAQDLIRLDFLELKVRGSLLETPGRSTSIIEAAFTGQAHWGIYATLIIILSLGLVFAARHIAAIYQFSVNGEHYIEGHPLLEAILIYGLIWLVLFSTYGVIG